MDREALDLLGQEILAEREAQLRHFESQDAKAGVILGFSGILVALAGPAGVVHAAVLAVAFAAAISALMAFFPRSFPALDVHAIR